MYDIVIVNWNGGQDIEACVRSVIDHGGGFVASVIVVDNGSSDASADVLETIAGCKVVRLDRNEGFGFACNRGAELGSAPHLLFLNPDAALFPTTLSGLSDFLGRSDPTLGVVGIALLDEDGAVHRVCSRFPSVRQTILESFGLSRVFPSLGAMMREWDHTTSREVDQVIGAFFCVSRRLFTQLGGFDERFFVYFEEVDFAKRARDCGFSSYYLSTVSAFHKGGGISSRFKAARLFYSLRSRMIYAWKHFTFFGALLVSLTTLGPEMISRLVLLAVTGHRDEIGDLALGYRALWRWALHTRAGRRASPRDREAMN